ncbi:phytanoyl-CoA dioxygenase family protein [Chitinimonas sp. BJB300]|uniref:phytanoyl-CoA dioxygenase family protein n=1 Tax=Chitinimonas sp. BJB300 TaxID=1559339 RepID=UPI000C101E10|nr:phytanoyl-CoA dioxygenase family protein [Chitinimonas sp. BJB300]PHV09744.1 phytanoyl-CoA dioxygenase [Chitinimonas sp. BJB300]TSJ84596.1 phytanoyl-CoA dioxygenase family protein [Chitinimonas sp. BJB300]
MLEEQGFEIIEAVLTLSECDEIAAKLSSISLSGAGTRNLLKENWCADLSRKVFRHPSIYRSVPPSYIAVQCNYFEKSKENNWLVPLHQDISIPVLQRVNHPQLSGWSGKEGFTYVQPPLNVLQSLVTVRIHIDACGTNDGPIKVVPKSHMLGIVSAESGLKVRRQSEEVSCIVSKGGAVVMRPLILHASSKATGDSRRRVLHFLFGPPYLPYGLQWQASVICKQASP